MVPGGEFRHNPTEGSMTVELRRLAVTSKPTRRIVYSGRCVITGSLNTQHLHRVDL